MADGSQFVRLLDARRWHLWTCALVITWTCYSVWANFPQDYKPADVISIPGGGSLTSQGPLEVSFSRGWPLRCWEYRFNTHMHGEIPKTCSLQWLAVNLVLCAAATLAIPLVTQRVHRLSLRSLFLGFSLVGLVLALGRWLRDANWQLLIAFEYAMFFLPVAAAILAAVLAHYRSAGSRGQ